MFLNTIYILISKVLRKVDMTSTHYLSFGSNSNNNKINGCDSIMAISNIFESKIQTLSSDYNINYTSTVSDKKYKWSIILLKEEKWVKKDGCDLLERMCMHVSLSREFPEKQR